MSKRICAAVLCVLSIPVSFAAGKKGRDEFQVRALSYRAVPHESETSLSSPNCYGSGADSAFWATLRLNCGAMTTPPPPVSPSNYHYIEVYNLVEQNGTIYAIACKAIWVGNECAWMMPGQPFQAQVQDWTMWVTGLGKKDKRHAYRLLDVWPASGADSAPPDTGLSGSYAGAFRDAVMGNSAHFAIAIRNENGSLSGCMLVQPPLFGTGLIHGSITGKRILFDAVAPAYRLSFRGDLQGTEVKGLYALAPVDDSGPFELLRQSQDSLPAELDLKDCLKSLASF